MYEGRGVKRKRGSAKPRQIKVCLPWVPSIYWLLPKTTFNIRFSPPPNRFFPVSSYVGVLLVVKGKRARITLPRKHHSLQEFKRLAKRVKANETKIIVKKLKSLRSLSNEPGTITYNPAKTPQDLEAQLIALKVRVAHLEERVAFSSPLGSESSAFCHRRPHSEAQAQPHPLHRQNCIGIPFYSAPALSSPRLLHG